MKFSSFMQICLKLQQTEFQITYCILIHVGLVEIFIAIATKISKDPVNKLTEVGKNTREMLKYSNIRIHNE